MPLPTTIMEYGPVVIENSTTGIYQFTPVPQISIEKTYDKGQDGTVFGTTYTLILAGILVGGHSSGVAEGKAGPIAGGLSEINLMREQLQRAFAPHNEGKELIIKSSGDTEVAEILRCYPRINSISFDQSSQNNFYWVLPFSIELEYDVDSKRLLSGGSIGIYPTGNLLVDAEAPFGDIEPTWDSGNDYDLIYPSGERATAEKPYGDNDYYPSHSGNPQPFILDASEAWDFEIIDDGYYDYSLHSAVVKPMPGVSGYIDGSGFSATGVEDRGTQSIRISHNISAVGKKHYDSSGLTKPAWQQAKDYVLPLLGVNRKIIGESGSFNLCSGDYQFYNHNRITSIDELGGGYDVQETWVALPSGAKGTPWHGATEEFDVGLNESSTDGIASFSIQGTIQGYDEKEFGPAIGDTSGDFCDDDLNEGKRPYKIIVPAHVNASGYWYYVQDRILDRVRTIANRPNLTYNTDYGYPINPVPLSKTTSYNLREGTVSYTFEFNTRPSNCVADALSENISVSDTHPVDVFAQIQVLGRAAGPVLQAIGTKTISRREISVEVTMNPATGCPRWEQPGVDLGVWTTGAYSSGPAPGEDRIGSSSNAFVGSFGTAPIPQGGKGYNQDSLGNILNVEYPAEGVGLEDVDVVSSRFRVGGPRYHQDQGYGMVNAGGYQGIGDLLFFNNPRNEVGNLIDMFYLELVQNNHQVFIDTHSESWNPKTGRYTRTVGFTYQRC